MADTQVHASIPTAADGTYAAMFDAVVKRYPESRALIFPGSVLTYRELLGRARRRARELRALGLGQGDTFGMMLPNSPEFVEFFLGGSFIGAIPVPINTRYKPFEVEHVCRDAQLRALISTSRLDEQLPLRSVIHAALPGLAESAGGDPLALEGFPALRHVVLLGEQGGDGMLSEAELIRLGEQIPEVEAYDPPSPDAALLIMYTSGTTSMAKGCVLSNDALTANVRGTADRFEIPSDDRWWNPLPMFHMGSILLMSSVFSRGATFISMEHFDPAAALALCAEFRPTVLYPLFPTITLTFMQHPDFAAYDRNDVRVVCNVSPEAIQVDIQETFAPAILISAYGMTELCGTLAYSKLSDSFASRTQTCGPLLPGWEAAIVDPETGVALPPDTKGELIAKGRSLTSGYYRNPAQTAATVDADGFFHTGDLCSMDAEGFLLFHGRLKDVLKVGGENVSALEVESFLTTHPAIKLAQIVGVPDDRLMEVPAVFIELTPGSTVEAQEVIDFCRGQIANFKIPRHVRFVTEWPMSSTKIQKFRLRHQLLEELENAPARDGAS
jgi:fatty-acyl-CoA synthase